MMSKHRNFGLSQPSKKEKEFDNWDLGFISKAGIKARREQTKADTENTKMLTNAINKILSEPSPKGDEESGAGTAWAIGIVILVLGLGVAALLIKRKQAPNSGQEVPVAEKIV